MALKVGELFAELKLNKDDYDKGLDSAEKKGTDWSKKIGTTLKVGAMAGGAAILGIGVASTKMAMDFDSSMAEVRTLLPDISDKVFGQLQSDVMGFSREMGIATGEAVPALYQAISAGVPQDNVIDFMRIAAKASIGGVTDLETAVDGITSVVNAYGSEAMEAGRASDVMFTAVKLGKTDFTQLSASLFNVIPTAASLGIEFEEVAGALALMTAQGTPTSVATTQLRQLFVEAAKSGTKLDDAIRKMAGKSMVDLVKEGADASVIMNDLRASVGDEEFRDLFGSVQGLNAALAITGPNAEAMADNLGEMRDAAGATDKAFETVADSAQYKLNKAINVVKISMLEFGMKILPILVAVGEKVVEMVGKAIPHLQRFGEWFDKNIRPLIEAFIGWLVPQLQTLMELVRIELAKLGEYYETEIRPAIENIATVVKWLVDRFLDYWPEISAIVEVAFKIIWTVVSTVMKVIFGIIRVTLDLIQGDWAGAWENLKRIFSDLWGGIEQLIFLAFEGLKALGKLMIAIGEDIVRGLWEGIKNLSGWLFDQVKGFASDMVNSVKETLKVWSPSQVFAEIGESTMEGLAQGMERGYDEHVAPVLDTIAAKIGMARHLAGFGNELLFGKGAEADARARAEGGAAARTAAAQDVLDHLTMGGVMNQPETLADVARLEAIQAAQQDLSRALAEELSFMGSMPSFAGGGVMRHDGPAYLHAGERVLTPQQQGMGTTIVIHAPNYLGPERELVEPVKRVLLNLQRTGAITEVLN